MKSKTFLHVRRIFKIPRQTLSNKFFGKSPLLCSKPGPEAVLGKDAEKRIENWILDGYRRGFSMHKDAIIYSVKTIIDKIPEEIKQKLPFKNNTPGKGWYSSFRKRHPKVLEKYNESKLNVQCTDDHLCTWFANAEAIIDEDDAEDAIHDPSRIFIMDELMIRVTSENVLILSDKKKSIGRSLSDHDELEFSFLLAADASGKVTLPCITRKPHCSQETPVEPLTCESALTCEIFYDSIVNKFYPNLIKKQCSFPVVIFLGCDFPYLSLPLSNFCKAKGLSMICLPKNSKEIQSIDSSVQYVLNKEWQRHDPDLSRIRVSLQQNVIDMLHKLIREDAFELHIVQKFHSNKLYPFNAEERSKKPEHFNKKLKNYSRNRAVDYMEREIPHGILMQFRQCRAGGTPWDGTIGYTALYEFWLAVVHDAAELLCAEENITDSDDDEVEVEWMDIDGEAVEC